MNVLCVMAHPDDEVLGCGGTLAKHAEAGDLVQFICMGRFDLQRDFVRATRVLAHNRYHFCGTLPDQSFETVPFSELGGMIDPERTYKPDPDIIYTHHPGDLNQDHALTAKAVLTAFRPKPGEKARTILACEVLSSTEYTYPPVFQPNYFVTLTHQLVGKKISALHSYTSEVKEWPHPRSGHGITYSALYRGQQIGVEYAEAFQLLRAVWDD